MTTEREPLSRRMGRWLEHLFALLILAGLVRVIYMTYENGYFPQPFFYDADDTWRDWFSTALWAFQEGAYDEWLTIYPPLSFVLLKFMAIPSCYYFGDDRVSRMCDWYSIYMIHGIYVFNAILTSLAMVKLDRKTALPRSFALVAGMPMIFGLERGNLVLLCYTFMVFAFGPLLKSARLRWFFAGLAVNLKIYIIAAVLTQLLRRRWLAVEGTLIAVVLIWIMAYGIYGAGTPIQLYENIVNWSTGAKPGSILDIWYPNTYNPLLFVLQNQSIVLQLVDSKTIDAGVLAINLLVHTAQLLILMAAAATWVRPEVVPPFRLIFFGLALAMITSETSAYTQPILILFVFMERWRGWARPLAIISCYVLCIPGDIHIGGTLNVPQFSYISGRHVFNEQGLSITMFLRPLLLMLPAYFLSIHTIGQVWLDIRDQGWSRRSRYRRDAPLLLGVKRPPAPRGEDAAQGARQETSGRA